jgi:hypothetical protein
MSGQTEVCPICKKCNPVPASKHDREEQLRLQREKEKQSQKEQEQQAQLQLQKDQQQAKLQRQTEILQEQQKQIEKHKGDIVYQMSLSWDITRKATGTEVGMTIFGLLSFICGVLPFGTCTAFAFTGHTVEGTDFMQSIAILLTCTFVGLLCFAIRWILTYLRTMPTRIIALQVENPVS